MFAKGERAVGSGKISVGARTTRCLRTEGAQVKVREGTALTARARQHFWNGLLFYRSRRSNILSNKSHTMAM